MKPRNSGALPANSLGDHLGALFPQLNDVKDVDYAVAHLFRRNSSLDK